MSTLKELHLKYIEGNLIPEIVSKLEDETLESSETEHSGGLDGFMSALYNIKLKTKTAKGGIKERYLIAKFMKGDVAFRESSKAYIEFANETFIYAKVLPAFKQVLKAANVTDVRVEDWVAPAYVAKFGYIEGLSATPTDRESVLVLENLKPQGYRLGPDHYLNRDHLLSMCKPLGEYHALSFALREFDPAQLMRLKSEIVPLRFIEDADPLDAKRNMFSVLHRIAFDRFFEYFDRKIKDDSTFDRKSETDLKLIANLQRLRERHFEEPSRLLERLRTQVEESEEDRFWAAIIHGDFYRNNVLFAYKQEPVAAAERKENNDAEVRDVKMIDFQELRFCTPAFDLSFFMYFNMSENVRDVIWMDILRKYHAHMFATLSTIMKANKSDATELRKIDKDLEKYNFNSFNAHFGRYAFHGVVICLQFLHWILCSEAECTRISLLFETDMHGEEFRKLSMEAGGDEVNLRLLNIMRHASQMGYLDHI